MAIIYLIEQNPTYVAVVRQLFELVGAGTLTAVTSHITLLEVLVLPLQQGRSDLVRQYRDILVGSSSLALRPVDRSTAEKGAEIRALYDFRIPDAIQLATAELSGAQVFITNDRRLRAFREVEVLLLDEFVTSKGGGEQSRGFHSR